MNPTTEYDETFGGILCLGRAYVIRGHTIGIYRGVKTLPCSATPVLEFEGYDGSTKLFSVEAFPALQPNIIAVSDDVFAALSILRLALIQEQPDERA